MRVLIPEPVASAGTDLLRAHGYEIVPGAGVDPATIARQARDSHAILARAARFDASLMDACPNLQVIARHGVGFDTVDVRSAEELGIWVTNTPEALSTTVAEHAICLLLACARWLPSMHDAVRRGEFTIRSRLTGIDLDGKTLGIIGLGRIGRSVAAKAYHGLGMRVLAYDPFVTRADPPVELAATLEDLLRHSDAVTVHVPLNEATRGVIGPAHFASMKPNAIFINTSRGEVVDQHALVNALTRRTIRAAGLDVYDPEPPDSQDALLRLENVVLTPHVASLTEECTARMSLHAALSIHEVLSGRRPKWPVNNPVSPRNVHGRRSK